jgi:hypothetical protein
MKLVITLTFLVAYINTAFAAQTCSRIAIVNYQEVLVDPSSNAKGEGLRFYLEKDAKATDLLVEYQTNNAPKWQTAALSTFGSTLILTGILRSDSDKRTGLTSRNSLMLTGGVFIALSYLISKTLQYKNEFILQRSIDEYNKRNLPRIYFSPFIDIQSEGSKIGIGINKEF